MIPPDTTRTYLIVLIFLTASAGIVTPISMNCIPVINYVFFDLTALGNATTDYHIALNADNSSYISWNLCGYAIDRCPDQDGYANMFFNKNASCAHFTGNQINNNITWDLIDSGRPETGIRYGFTNGDYLTNATIVKSIQTYYSSFPTPVNPANTTLGFIVYIWCNETTTYNLINQSISNNTLLIHIHSISGCPKLNPSQIWSFISSNQWLFTIFSLVFGVLLCFFAYRLINITFFLLGFCVSFVPVMYLLFAFLVDSDTSTGGKWAILFFSLMIGCIIGYICVKLETVGFFAIGFALGYVCTNIIWVPILSRFTFSYPELIFFIIWVVLGVIFGFLVAKYPSFWVILTSSCYGSYLIVTPLMQILFNLPNEFEIAKQVSIGEVSSFPWSVWGYLVFLVLFAVGGFIFQIRKKREKEQEPVPQYYYPIPDAEEPENNFNDPSTVPPPPPPAAGEYQPPLPSTPLNEVNKVQDVHDVDIPQQQNGYSPPAPEARPLQIPSADSTPRNDKPPTPLHKA